MNFINLLPFKVKIYIALGLLVLIGTGIVFINRKIETSKQDYNKSEETEYSTVKEYLDLIIK
jgi:hypothetical protein